jgi:hypothetical protein
MVLLPLEVVGLPSYEEGLDVQCFAVIIPR